MKFKCLLFSAIVMFIVCLQSAEGEDITNAASFLEIGAGARAVGLGSAFVAAADDASAGYWNPAGLTQLSGLAVSLAERVPVVDTDYASLAMASPVLNFGFIGLTAIYYGCGDVIMYDSMGTNMGVLSDKEAALIFSYAYSLNQLSIGANVKYVYQDMSDYYTSVESDGIGADISVMYRVNDSLNMGAIFHNKYDMVRCSDGTISGESPYNIRAGIRYKLDMGRKNHLNFMMDFDQTRSYPLKLHTGMEMMVLDTFFLRVGLDDFYVETRNADISYVDLLKRNYKPTFGIGIKWNINKTKTPQDKEKALLFDYAMSVEEMGLRSFFTLAYQF